jgi:enoyl-CoA hydratase
VDATAVRYQRVSDGVSVITLDDGKANALSLPMQAAIGDALDAAERDDAAVVLEGRPGMFSGGFDLATLQGADQAAAAMVIGGFRLAERLLRFPNPVVVACSGHAVAMGAFLLLAVDQRLGAAGDFRIVANEVAIGLTMPRAAIELCRLRLSPAHFHRAVLTSHVHDPHAAVAAGFLDEVVAPDALAPTSLAAAARLRGLDVAAYRGTKARAVGPALELLAEAIAADDAELSAALA